MLWLMLINQHHIFSVLWLRLSTNVSLLWSTAVYVQLRLPNKLISKSCRSSIKILQIPSPLDPDCQPNEDPSTKQWLLLIWMGTRLPRSARAITPSLRSFARPLTVGEFAISSALVWWQLTSCKKSAWTVAPLWERLVTWPLMRRPHMYHKRPDQGWSNGPQHRCSASIVKDNDTTGCTNVEKPSKHSARTEDKATSSVSRRCYLHCFTQSRPESLSCQFKTACLFYEHLFCFSFLVDLDVDLRRHVAGKGILVVSDESATIVSGSICNPVKPNGLLEARETLTDGLSERWDHDSRSGCSYPQVTSQIASARVC